MPVRRILPLLACLLGGICHAAELAVFEDGRVLRVEAAEVAGDFARLRLVGGGEIAVPADRIVGFETLAPPPVATPPADNPRPAPARRPVGARWRREAGAFVDLIADAAHRHGIDRDLLLAVAKVESNFDPRAVSPKGASGLLQLMPGTAERFGVEDVFDPRQNVEGGARYLRWLLDRFAGETELALAGYNAGEHAVDRYQGVPPYAETRAYVVKVLRYAEKR